MILVCCCTFVSLSFIAWIALKHRQPTLVIIGDAIATFLETPDETTMPKINTPEHLKGKGFVQLEKIEWHVSARNFWYRAVGVKMWLLSLTM